MEKSWKNQSLKKVLDPKNLKRKVEELKSNNYSIATINGSFDILHAGHLHMLYEASLQADKLIVALNSDSSIKKYKGKQRPIIPLHYRMQLISALSFVDFVTWFDETDPINILSIICPTVHVNGEEYGQNCIEKDVVVSNGGKIHLVKRIDSLSTTEIIRKIKLCD